MPLHSRLVLLALLAGCAPVQGTGVDLPEPDAPSLRPTEDVVRPVGEGLPGKSDASRLPGSDSPVNQPMDSVEPQGVPVAVCQGVIAEVAGPPVERLAPDGQGGLVVLRHVGADWQLAHLGACSIDPMPVDLGEHAVDPYRLFVEQGAVYVQDYASPGWIAYDTRAGGVTSEVAWEPVEEGYRYGGATFRVEQGPGSAARVTRDDGLGESIWVDTAAEGIPAAVGEVHFSGGAAFAIADGLLVRFDLQTAEATWLAGCWGPDVGILPPVTGSDGADYWIRQMVAGGELTVEIDRFDPGTGMLELGLQVLEPRVVDALEHEDGHLIWRDTQGVSSLSLMEGAVPERLLQDPSAAHLVFEAAAGQLLYAIHPGGDAPTEIGCLEL